MIYFYESPMGMLALEEDAEGFLRKLDFMDKPADLFVNSVLSPTIQEIFHQLDAYFAGSLREFDIPIDLDRLPGTDFQKSVWAALMRIPYGEVHSYADIARDAGRPKACRAVGNANHYNPIAVIIPCHRVIQASGALGGYGGGLDKKTFLLALEKKYRA